MRVLWRAEMEVGESCWESGEGGPHYEEEVDFIIPPRDQWS